MDTPLYVLFHHHLNTKEVSIKNHEMPFPDFLRYHIWLWLRIVSGIENEKQARVKKTQQDREPVNPE
jgi:hypothetical protein